ncbi:MAG: HAD family hydrolase [Candidatus Odinarchaeia archaeon]
MIKKGIIFDLDGTLIQTPGIPMYNKIMRKTLRDIGISNLTYEEISKIWSSGEKNREILKKWGVKNTREFWETFDENDYKLREKLIKKGEIRTYPDIDILNKFKKEYKLGLVSNSSKKVVDLELESFNLRKFFNSIVILGTEYQDYSKPEPHGLIWCIKKMNLTKEECIYVGDLKIDLIAGLRAGVLTFIIDRKGNRKIPNSIRSLYELINILNFHRF